MFGEHVNTYVLRSKFPVKDGSSTHIASYRLDRDGFTVPGIYQVLLLCSYMNQVHAEAQEVTRRKHTSVLATSILRENEEMWIVLVYLEEDYLSSSAHFVVAE